jgi:hypothetical protein
LLAVQLKILFCILSELFTVLVSESPDLDFS